MTEEQIIAMEAQEIDDAVRALMEDDNFVRLLAWLDVVTDIDAPSVLVEASLPSENYKRGQRAVVRELLSKANKHARVPALKQEVQRYEYRRSNADRSDGRVDSYAH